MLTTKTRLKRGYLEVSALTVMSGVALQERSHT